MLITIDGPAGTGKSTVARLLAERLRIGFLDTGAMYRAVAWRALQTGILPEQQAELAALAGSLEFRLEGQRLLVNGADPGEELRSPQVSGFTSRVAIVPAVREVLVAQQRRIAERQSLVTEGRDQGTVVFPQATCKFFLTATPEVRALRRYRDLAHQPDPPTFEQVLNDQQERDDRDFNREVAPLRPASDAILVETSHLSLEAVVQSLEQLVQEKLNQ